MKMVLSLAGQVVDNPPVKVVLRVFGTLLIIAKCIWHSIEWESKR